MNTPNEPGSFDSDFSYDYLAQLYGKITQSFRLSCIGDAASVVDDATRPTAFIRHDVDVSLHRAIELARMEVEWGARSTYHVMIDSPFYDVRSDESAGILAELAALGHEVGLHYDVQARGMASAERATREGDIARACDDFAAVLGKPVRSVSFHLPIQELIRGPLEIAGRVSGYGDPLFRWYISDSRARWREGPPIESLAKPRSHVLQILIHPVWWGKQHMRPEHRLRDLVRQIAERRAESYEAVRDRMTPHILYRAADL